MLTAEIATKAFASGKYIGLRQEGAHHILTGVDDPLHPRHANSLTIWQNAGKPRLWLLEESYTHQHVFPNGATINKTYHVYIDLAYGLMLLYSENHVLDWGKDQIMTHKAPLIVLDKTFYSLDRYMWVRAVK